MRRKREQKAQEAERQVSLEEIQELAARIGEKAREQWGPGALWERYKAPILLAGGTLAVVGGLRTGRQPWTARVPWGWVAAGAGAAAALGAMLWAANRAGQVQPGVAEGEAGAPREADGPATEEPNPPDAEQANTDGAGPELERISMRRR